MKEKVKNDDIIAFFNRLEKNVVSFVGYSGAEYEDKEAMLQRADAMLDEFDPANTVINSGATLQGIGAVYELAKRREFTTTGIVSRLAKKYKVKLSPFVDHIFFIEDDTWGGFLEESEELSPTSKTILAVSDVLIGIGGGEVARDELTAALQAGKEVHFMPADMNHKIAIQKAKKKRLPKPTEFSGAAGQAFPSAF